MEMSSALPWGSLLSFARFYLTPSFILYEILALLLDTV
jgi:hypothetical protein